MHIWPHPQKKVADSCSIPKIPLKREEIEICRDQAKAFVRSYFSGYCPKPYKYCTALPRELFAVATAGVPSKTMEAMEVISVLQDKGPVFYFQRSLI